MDELRKLEIRARELLAAECAKAYAEPFGAPIDSHEIAVRAIVAALAAIPEGGSDAERFAFCCERETFPARDQGGQQWVMFVAVKSNRRSLFIGDSPREAVDAAMLAASPPLAASRAEQEPQP